MKTTITDETMNKLARYVNKTVGLIDLDCDYDINREKCRKCIYQTKNVV